ncbi:YchJ family protein [Mycobacterium sp. NAZ190054]|uniref:YchJ family protein n=1 Tax=Mycobacterium sp. NAZ190054 TaxID=1747766 RepID=UPI000797EC3D|nr:YchJ family metal-binding protein [Mycobacterium sp. NAZ190054]KWX56673.1 zinc chelation protein SecC [Mycobacterium sp. NAZ190054]
MRADDNCPCGSGAPFGRCCLPLHVGERQAGSAEQLMRSRYSAYVAGASEYLWRTWHPRTRPDEVAEDITVTWTRLEILDVVAGQAGDETGEVEFRAHHRAGALHERSRFAVRAGRWFYVDGDLLD